MVGRAHNCKKSLSGVPDKSGIVVQESRRPVLVQSADAGETPSPLNLSAEEQKALHEALRRSVTVVKRGRPRLEDAKNTLSATKPWDKLGMSERTWYRRQKESND
jgi:hypothetical protein